MAKYYVDTSIWRDLHENRTDRFRPLGEWAFEFFKKVRIDNAVVLFSDLVVQELLDYFDKKTVDSILRSFTGKIEKVEITAVHSRKARILCKEQNIPFGDALHIILAKYNAAIMITRDHHFDAFSHLVEIKKPEDLI